MSGLQVIKLTDFIRDVGEDLKLKEFYKSCAFEEFKMPSDAECGESLGQLFCFLND